jgi:hypothetical protein
MPETLPQPEPVRRSKRSIWLVALFGCILAAIGGRWLATSPTKEVAEKPGLRINPNSLDFGEAWESDSLRWPVEFENTDKKPICIERFDIGGCDCVKVDVERLMIPAGGRGTVTAVLDLTRHRPAVISGESWPDRLPLRVECRESTGRKSQMGWFIQGKVKALVTVEPGFIWFGDDLLRGTAGQPRQVLIRPLVPLNDLLISSQPEGFECTLKRVSNGYKLTATPTNRLPSGFISRDLRLSVYDRHDKLLPAQTITIFGTVTESVAALPRSTSFGPVRVGEIGAASITVGSRIALPFEVTKIESPPGLLILEQGKQNDQWHVRIEQRLDGLGSQSVTMKIHVRLSSGETVNLPVTFTWCGVAAETDTQTGS